MELDWSTKYSNRCEEMKEKGARLYRMAHALQKRLVVCGWVDKKPMLLLSIHANPLSPHLAHLITVPQYSNGKTTNILTLCVHLEYS